MNMPNANDLKTRVVNVAGKEVIVSQGTLRMSMRRDHMRSMALQQLLAPGSEELSPLEQVFIVEIYPAMAACSSGELPSAVELLDTMVDLETDSWYVACTELNPHWFVKDENSEGGEEIKKKSRSRRRSVRKT